MINISFFPSFFRQPEGLIHRPAVVSDSLNLNTLLTGSLFLANLATYRVASSAILDAATAMVSSPVSKPLRDASIGLTLRSSS